MIRLTAARPRTRLLLVLVGLSVSFSCSRPVDKSETAASSSPDPAPPAGPGVNQTLTSYQQRIQSSVTNVAVHVNESFQIPTHIENPGAEQWLSAGTKPVTISYKWFSGSSMLPIEGERTLLPKPIAPGASLDVPVRVVAPGQPGKYELRVTLVQEGVAWFMTKSGTYLALPAVVR